MEKIYYSDLADIPADVCIASLDENLKPITEGVTAHKWDDTTEPVSCSECGEPKE